MGTKKAAGGVEDLTFGMGTETQIRKGQQTTITQINADKIPYSSTQSTKAKVDQVDAKALAAQTAIDNHVNDFNNPHNITIGIIGAAPADHEHDVRYFRKDEYRLAFTNPMDSGYPIVLSGDGKIHPSLIPSSGVFMGPWTPTAGNEYPNTDGVNPGSYWLITGVDPTNGYTFQTGDLAGQTIENGNAMLYGQDAWAIINLTFLPNEYYKLDGQYAITAPFQGGGQEILNIADGQSDTSGATVGQLNTHVNDTSNPHQVTYAQVGAEPADPAIQAHLVDTNNPHQVTTSQIGAEPDLGLGTAGQLLATNAAADGKEWVDAPNSAIWGLITGDINAQTDLQAEFLNKEDAAGDTMAGPVTAPRFITPTTQGSFTVHAGENAMVGGFELPDGETITIEDGGRLVII